ncbi:helix-turn-helix domain-containing protein [Nafulsella turpanensis]|uniref:helix-turn-helix domain-containing protein n=1 Tax=Nafulsella turpanensis TaxID=1265690 RepID=UPI000346BAE4|nr:helix-turn-helix transcriptional regulator [Nafulsella turpanensis]
MKKEVIFGYNFKKYRKSKGISQKEFAALLYEATGKKLTLTSVSNYETGLHMPPPQVLPAIADILEVSIDALFGVEEKAVVEAESLDPQVIDEWKRELERLEKEFILWGAAQEEGFIDMTTQSFATCCEDLIVLAKKQQHELLVLQAELRAIRKMIAALKGGFGR